MNAEMLHLLEKLRDILEEEMEYLRQKAWDELPRLSARKLTVVSCINELMNNTHENPSMSPSQDANRLIDEICMLNERNGVYIEEMLSFYQGILSAILPNQYNVQGVSTASSMCTRGLAIRKEV